MSLKRIVVIFILTYILFVPGKAFAKVPQVTAQAAIVIDAESGSVIYSKNAYQKMYPASTTKVLTSIMGIEMGDLKEKYEVTPNAARVGEASIHLGIGDKIDLLNLIVGALIKSGNDASYAIGECIAGDEELFVYLMNKKAYLLGGKNTTFYNTNGLPHDKHMTSAYDLALISRFAMQNELFSQIVNTKETSIQFLDGQKRYLKNTNKLLWMYEYADGIKTGTTNKAGSCLIASATKNNRQYITVVLKSNNRYKDAESLLNHALNNYHIVHLAQKTYLGEIYLKNAKKTSTSLITAYAISAISTVSDKDKFEVKVSLPQFLNAPIKKGQVVGKVEILLKNKIIDTSPIIIQEDVNSKSYFKNLKKLVS